MIYKTKEENGVEYKYVKNKLSKNIKISVKSPFLVQISYPYNCPYKKAKDFLKSKKNWIEENLKRFEFNMIDENFQTKTGNLIIMSGLVKTPIIKKAGRVIQFIYPIGADFYSKEIQEKVKEALKRALYIEAKEYLPKRLDELAQKFGFKYNKLALKNSKTRWGSCSFSNNINLNTSLLSLDFDCIDYVLIHELAHTVEKNHGGRFWALVEKCMPNAKEIRKKMKNSKYKPAGRG